MLKGARFSVHNYRSLFWDFYLWKAMKLSCSFAFRFSYKNIKEEKLPFCNCCYQDEVNDESYRVQNRRDKNMHDFFCREHCNWLMIYMCLLFFSFFSHAKLIVYIGFHFLWEVLITEQNNLEKSNRFVSFKKKTLWNNDFQFETFNSVHPVFSTSVPQGFTKSQ